MLIHLDLNGQSLGVITLCAYAQQGYAFGYFLCIYIMYCIYIYMFICMSTKNQAVYRFTTRKSYAECIPLLSHWVKMLPMSFAKSSELYRQSNSYFSIMVNLCKAQCCSSKVSFTALIVCCFSSVHWKVHTGYVFCGTLVAICKTTRALTFAHCNAQLLQFFNNMPCRIAELIHTGCLCEQQMVNVNSMWPCY